MSEAIETRIMSTRWIVAFQAQEGERFSSFMAKPEAGPPGTTTMNPHEARGFGNEEAALDAANRIRSETQGRCLACAAKVETRVEVLPIDVHFHRLIKAGWPK